MYSNKHRTGTTGPEPTNIGAPYALACRTCLQSCACRPPRSRSSGRCMCSNCWLMLIVLSHGSQSAARSDSRDLILSFVGSRSRGLGGSLSFSGCPLTDRWEPDAAGTTNTQPSIQTLTQTQMDTAMRAHVPVPVRALEHPQGHGPVFTG